MKTPRFVRLLPGVVGLGAVVLVPEGQRSGA